MHNKLTWIHVIRWKWIDEIKLLRFLTSLGENDEIKLSRFLTSLDENDEIKLSRFLASLGENDLSRFSRHYAGKSANLQHKLRYAFVFILPMDRNNNSGLPPPRNPIFPPNYYHIPPLFQLRNYDPNRLPFCFNTSFTPSLWSYNQSYSGQRNISPTSSVFDEQLRFHRLQNIQQFFENMTRQGIS